MKLKIGLFFLALQLVLTIDQLPHYFHTTLQIIDQIEHLVQECQYVQKQQHSANPNIISLTFQNQHHLSNKLKAFIIFGEHSRELVSSEIGLKLIKQLCDHSHHHHQILNHYNIKIIVNMNPNARKYVEQGHFCIRENHNGVDLNRNYDIEWEHIVDHHMQCSSGDRPFSEIETQTVRDILQEFKPKVFLSIHSGTLAIVHPYAYKKEKGQKNLQNLQEVAEQVSQEYCQQCLVGSAAQEIGYTATGSSQDYAYDIANVDYSYTFETHSAQDVPSGSKIHKSHFLNQVHHHQGKKNNKKMNRKILIQKVEVKEEPLSNFAQFLEEKNKQNYKLSRYDEFCFLFFNPVAESTYKYETTLWSKAIVRTLELIHHKENN